MRAMIFLCATAMVMAAGCSRTDESGTHDTTMPQDRPMQLPSDPNAAPPEQAVPDQTIPDRTVPQVMPQEDMPPPDGTLPPEQSMPDETTPLPGRSPGE